MKNMRDGLIGDVYMARGLCFKPRDTIGARQPEPVPAGVHYDLWPGPLPRPSSPKTDSTTTGIGSGTTAMATSETREFTNWISRAGDWA